MSKFRVIPREEWGARPPKRRSTLVTDKCGVFIHHTAGKRRLTKRGERKEMQAMQAFHMDGHGWNDIGYSFVVFRSGRIYEGRGRGTVGAHTEDFNHCAYGIAAAGNYDKYKPTKKMLRAMRWLRRHYLGLKNEPLRAHGDVNPTACPGKHLRKKLHKL